MTIGGGAGTGPGGIAIDAMCSGIDAAGAGPPSVQPAGSSTGCTTWCTGPPSVTRGSTATYAVNRHSTPKRSEVATIRCSNSVDGLVT
jgi:hypothetical protein